MISRWRLGLVVGGLAVRAACGAEAARAAEPAWVVDPAQPGAHLPPRGASLFDQLFAAPSGRGHALPFPFERLIARIERELAPATPGGLPPLKAVLVPLGRSLQRTAAAPDYFRFPRVVVAVDTLPAAGSSLLLKDRLYIGYQERSAVLEVISYSETAGRFEFQLVKNYRAGGQPRVFQANRTLCYACHQNGAPIFSRALWDETNANPAIAARLKATGRAYYGVPPERGVDLPYAIDVAVRRANRLALAQRLWREGCGEGEAGWRCRAGLWQAALRLRLGDDRRLPPDPAFEVASAAPLRLAAGRLWPGGLALGRADLPNRNPLPDGAAWPADPAGQVARSHVPAVFDPLLPRAAEQIWRADSPQAVDEAVEAIASFVVDGRWPNLLAALARRAAALPRVVVALRCEPTATTKAECRGDGGQRLRIDMATGQIEGLRLGAALPHPAFAARPAPALRLAGGDWLERLDMTGLEKGRGTLRLVLRDDSGALAAALRTLAGGEPWQALLDGRPVPGEALLDAVLAELGAGRSSMPGPVLPQPQLELPVAPPVAEAGGVAPALAAFHAWCAACHWTAETFPPNFLHGPVETLEGRLRQCAPRIYVRLAMARMPPDQRVKTPMPPETLLPAFGTHAEAWARSPERGALEATIRRLLPAGNGREPDLPTLLAGGYEALPPCLAPARP